MASHTVFILGDAHLRPEASGAAKALYAFLESVPARGDHVVLNGDVFDFWFEYRSVIPRRHFATLARLAELTRRGVGLTVMGGNHDRWGLGFWQGELGATFHPGAMETSLGRWRAFVAHGDGLVEGHWGARLLHGLTRHRAVVGTFRWIHPDLAFRLVERFSWMIAENTRDAEVLDAAAAAQARWARRLMAQQPELNLVILGHTHRPMLEELSRQRWYLNPGAWMEGFCYAAITERGPELRQFESG